MIDAESEGRHARESLDQTAIRLDRLDRSQLAPDQLRIFDQVSGFVRAGRRAADASDYVAASGFARKVAQLALKLEQPGESE
jgi:hypothetical protein